METDVTKFKVDTYSSNRDTGLIFCCFQAFENNVCSACGTHHTAIPWNFSIRQHSQYDTVGEAV